MKKPDTKLQCDLCHREFNLTQKTLTEKEVILRDAEGEELKRVWMTQLTCPCCGKIYPVIVDDEITIPLADKLKRIMVKQIKQAKKGYSSPELEKKRRELNWKLDFKRQKLANEYNGSFYQLEDGTMEQLEYRYHAR